MKLIIKRGFCLGHGLDVYPGDTVELDDATADRLIRSGRAQILPQGKAPEPEQQPQPEPAEEPADADDKPKRKGSKHA